MTVIDQEKSSEDILDLSFIQRIWRHNHPLLKAGANYCVAIKNETPEFSIQKIYLCSSASAIDSSQEKKLDKLDLYQYTDIAVYINNFKDE